MTVLLLNVFLFTASVLMVFLSVWVAVRIVKEI